MKRAQRLRPLHDLADQNERSCALRVADCERRIAAGEQRYEELVRYRLEYQQLFHARASGGAPMRGLVTRAHGGFLRAVRMPALFVSAPSAPPWAGFPPNVHVQ